MAYSREHSHLITDHWSAITNDVEMKHIVDLLIPKRVISPTDWDEMKKAHPLTKDQMHAFLAFLVKQPESSFKKFIEALKESGKYDHIVEILQTSDSRYHPPMQEQNLFTPANFRRLWDEVHNNKKEQDRKLDATNKEIYNLKILLARKENEIEKLKEKSQKREVRIAKLTNDIKAEIRHRTDAETKLKIAEGDIERIRREYTDLINLSRETTETERLIREETELKLRRSEAELARVRRESTELSSSRHDTKNESEKRLRKEAVANQPKSELQTVRTENRQSEQNITMILTEAESSSNEAALQQEVMELTKQLHEKTRERDALARNLKKSIICSIL